MKLDTTELLETTAHRKFLEAEIEALGRPLRTALAEALGGLPELLREAKAAESDARAALSARYFEAEESRTQEILAGRAPSELETPGVSVRHGKEIEVSDPDRIPREYLVPDLKAIRAAGGCLGTEVVRTVTFAVKS